MLRIPTIALAAAVALVACQREETGSDEASEEPENEPETEGAVPPPENVSGPPEDAQTTDSGLAYKVLDEGDGGEPPGPSDRVEVHYTGWTTDGEMFDSSQTKGEPAELDVGGVIPGWTEGIQLMSEGDSYRFWIPEELAYGGREGPPEGMLVFDVELLSVTRSPEAPDDLEPPDDAETTDSGLAYEVLEEGEEEGSSPRSWDQVTVHYSGWTTDGEMFDSSVMKGEPASFPLTGVIPGWAEGIQLMSEGDSYRLWIPEELAYQDNPKGPEGMLIFDVELIEVEEMPKPPPVPESVSGPPPSAETTDEGVHYRVLEESDSDERPDENSVVTVHYTGWTTDGEMFDSSISRGEPATFPLARVIPGWANGLQTMTVGQKSRLWIPEELAYNENPRGPQGMLVFDVELVDVKEGQPAGGHGARPAPQPERGAEGESKSDESESESDESGAESDESGAESDDGAIPAEAERED